MAKGITRVRRMIGSERTLGLIDTDADLLKRMRLASTKEERRASATAAFPNRPRNPRWAG